MTALNKRSFLFLQGPLSPLYSRLGDAVASAGHDVHRINLCFGDWMDWRRGGGANYRGSVADWPDYVGKYMQDNAITDLVFHGDRRVYHKLAAERAASRGVRVVATELGYLRPDWMTIERDATSTGSHFPDDPAAIRDVAAQVPAPDLRPIYRGSFFWVAFPDVIYNLSNVLFWFLYPRFQRHTIYHPVIEYSAWILRLISDGRRQRRAREVLARLKASGRPYFVFPMQLEGDFQIRDHSPYSGMADALDAVMRSFAAHAPGDSQLLIKAHPLDNGLEKWPGVLQRLIHAHGLQGRAEFVDGGRLDEMIKGAAGLVTVNSTAGIESLMLGCPTKTMTPAIYDVDGMTDQQTLDAFWRSPTKPDRTILDDFIRALTGTIQVRGTIYSDDGLDAAVRNMADRILNDTLNLPGAFIDPPPRLDRARKLGAPL